MLERAGIDWRRSGFITTGQREDNAIEPPLFHFGRISVPSPHELSAHTASVMLLHEGRIPKIPY